MIDARDFWVALHSLRNSKGYVATIVVTLGITLGALVAMYNLNYQILAAPLPYPDQDRLFVMQTDIMVDGQNTSANSLNMTPYAAVIEVYKKDFEDFEQKALVSFYVDTIRNLPDTPQITSAYITPEYLQLSQPAMELGRMFNADETLDNHPPVSVISYATWQKIFKGDPDVLNRSLRFGEVDLKVIGVLAESFVEPQLIEIGRTTDVWIPWDFNRVPLAYRGWGSFIEHQFLVGKMKKNIDLAKVEQNLTVRLNARFKEETAAEGGYSTTTLQMRLVSYRDLILGDGKTRAYMLLAGALVLLLIAAANITNLILARAANRQRVMAIQAALGAQKFHLFNGFLTEILWLMVMASILSLVVAFFGINLLKEVAGSLLPRVSELGLTWQSFFVSLLVALLLAIFFASLLSHQVNYRALNDVLQTSGKGVGVQISAKVRKVLILCQIALTGVLLTASLQILQESLDRLSQPLGLATENVFQIILSMGSQANAPFEERRRNLVAIRDELLSNSKVQNVTLASLSPLGETIPSIENTLSSDADFRQAREGQVTYVDEKYIDVLGLELMSGRNITQAEFQTDVTSLVVNEKMASSLQSDGQVLNKRFYFGMGAPGNNLYEVVGIIRDLSLPGENEISRMFVAGVSADFPRLILEMKSGQSFTKEEVNNILAKVNAEYKASLLVSMPEAHKMLLAQETISAWLTAALALLTLGLAAIGTYGVLSYSVQLRRFELGIRMALGASPLNIFAQILKENLVPVVIGLVAALIAFALGWFWLQQSIYNAPINPLSFVASTLLIFVLAALASLFSVWAIIRKPAVDALRGS